MRKSGVKQVIFDIWQEHLDWFPKEIRSGVLDKLGTKKSRGGDYPGLRLVQKYVKEFKDNLGQVVDEDKPWSIAASLKYGLPPEATKDLFDIWRASLAMGIPISIRQAKWIVHIRELFYQPISTGNMYSDKVNRNLWLIRQSWLYSILERASRIMGEQHFDTTDLDAASFMPPWERATAIKLGKVSHIDFPQEALTKIEKHGTSLTSPAVSIKSVEHAVWHNVRAEPPRHMEIMGLGLGERPLPEEDDLVSAYWLNYLSKGPLWNNLPEQPDVKARLEYFRQERKRLREAGGLVPDSGGFPDDSLYSQQLSVRDRVLEWVKTHPHMTIRDYHTLTAQHPALVFNAILLKTVGYEVTPEDMELWFEFRKQQLKAQHKGYDQLLPDIQQRFIHDEQTPVDKEALERADYQVVLKQKQLEQEFIELVQHQGGAPSNKKGYKIVKDFWVSVRDEWVKKYPKYKKTLGGYLQWEEVQAEYERIIEEHKKGGTS